MSNTVEFSEQKLTLKHECMLLVFVNVMF